MPSSRVLVIALVALLAASTGKVPFFSKPVRAVVSLAFPSSSSEGALFDGDGENSSSSRSSRTLLTLAIRNATSDFDEVSLVCSETMRCCL